MIDRVKINCNGNQTTKDPGIVRKESGQTGTVYPRTSDMVHPFAQLTKQPQNGEIRSISIRRSSKRICKMLSGASRVDAHGEYDR